VNKCKVMHTGTNNRNDDYSMNGQSPDGVSEHTDLGIIVSSNHKAADHCHCATIGKSDAGTYQTNG